MGPEDVSTKQGEKYMLNFIDDFSGMSWIFPLRKKSETFKVYRDWKVLVENESGENIKIFCIDNGGEYMSNLRCTSVRTVFCTKQLHHTRLRRMDGQNSATEQL
jgi:hypothetical protein